MKARCLAVALVLLGSPALAREVRLAPENAPPTAAVAPPGEPGSPME
jgi:hypothetical protein